MPKLTVSSDEIVKIGNLERVTFSKRGKVLRQKFKALSEIKVADPTKILGDLWKCAWLLKSQRPLWNGYMQMVHKGDHPGKSSVIFMPMIDMPSSDMSCILSMMEFVSKQARQYNHTPILTFDQPLYWKAMEIRMWENAASDLKEIILFLRQFHARMSFIGSIGHLMTGSGLDAILKLIYADNTVPHMSGKAYSRGICGLLLITASLYGYILSKIYGCHIMPATIDAPNDAPSISNEVIIGIASCDHKLKDVSDLLDKVYSDAAIVTHFLTERNPFIISEDLFSLETGEVADSKVNAYKAKPIGEQILVRMVDVPVLEYIYTKRKTRLSS